MPHEWAQLDAVCVARRLLICALSRLWSQEIQAHHNTHSFHLAKELQDRGDHQSPKSSVRLFPRRLWLCFSFSFLQTGVGRRAALATGSCEFFTEWKMSSRGGRQPLPRPPAHPSLSSPDPTHSPPPKWHLTPRCVYIRPQKWEIVMSHSGCVFTLQSHARKEISHGLLKAARWERIAAVHQGCSDLALATASIYFVSFRRPAGRWWRCAGAGNLATARGEKNNCFHTTGMSKWDSRQFVASNFLQSSSSMKTHLDYTFLRPWQTDWLHLDDCTFLQTIDLQFNLWKNSFHKK